jgi:hypothetical protein
MEVKKRYQIEISSRFAAFENLNDSKGLGDIKENTKTSAKQSLGL